MSANKAYVAIILKLGGVTPPPTFDDGALYFYIYGDAYYFSEGDFFQIP